MGIDGRNVISTFVKKKKKKKRTTCYFNKAPSAKQDTKGIVGRAPDYCLPQLHTRCKGPRCIASCLRCHLGLPQQH